MASATYPSTVTRHGLQRLGDLRGGSNWVYLIPALIFFVGYQVYPLLQVAYISFTDYHFLRHDPVQFTGFLNYANAFSDPLVLEGLKRAAAFTAIFLPGVIFIPLFVAILVERVTVPWLATVYLLILLIPAVIPGPMIAIEGVKSFKLSSFGTLIVGFSV